LDHINRLANKSEQKTHTDRRRPVLHGSTSRAMAIIALIIDGVPNASGDRFPRSPTPSGPAIHQLQQKQEFETQIKDG
jgi:hypothetical protein